MFQLLTRLALHTKIVVASLTRRFSTSPKNCLVSLTYSQVRRHISCNIHIHVRQSVVIGEEQVKLWSEIVGTSTNFGYRKMSGIQEQFTFLCEQTIVNDFVVQNFGRFKLLSCKEQMLKKIRVKLPHEQSRVTRDGCIWRTGSR